MVDNSQIGIIAVICIFAIIVIVGAIFVSHNNTGGGTTTYDYNRTVTHNWPAPKPLGPGGTPPILGPGGTHQHHHH